jgi:hypothetical protein
MNSLVLSIGDQLSVNDGHLSVLAKVANPEFHVLFSGRVKDEALGLGAIRSGRLNASYI